MNDDEFLNDRDCTPKGRTMSLRDAAQALVKSWDRDPQGPWPELKALRDALAEAEKAEPVAKNIAAQVPQWKEDGDRLEDAVRKVLNPPAALPELTDDDIEAIWFATVEDMPRGSTNREIRVAGCRAVLAAARGKG